MKRPAWLIERAKTLAAVVVAAMVGVAGAILHVDSARAVDLVVWHDKGDDGIRVFEEIAAAYRRERPDVNIRSLSFPTEQWFSRTIAAINTGTGPDLLFNDNFRIARIQQSTSRLRDLTDQVDRLSPDARPFINESDLAASRYDNRLVMLPNQRVLVGWGVRRTWLEHLGEQYPTTWPEMIRIARRMQEGTMPGAGGRVFGVGMQAGEPSVLFQMLEIFYLGSGLPHVAVDANAEVLIDRPEYARVLVEFIKLYTEHRVVPPESVNHIFTDMYQLIEGGRNGFFRVGDFNVRRFDTQALRGDYIIGPIPRVLETAQPSYIVAGMRSVAIPANGRNVEAALDLARYMISRPAQIALRRYMGAAVRTDLDNEGLTQNGGAFARPAAQIQPNDFPDANFPWFPQFKEAYYRAIIAAITNPPSDWNAWIAETATRMRTVVATLRRR